MESTARLIQTLELIREALGWDSTLWVESLEMTPTEWAAIRRGRICLPVGSALKICKALNISLESLESGQIDFLALASAQRNPPGDIPERYQGYRTSRAHTVQRLLRYASKKIGPLSAIHALRRMQYPLQHLSRPEEPVSVRALVDLNHYFKRYGLGERDHYQLGQLAREDLPHLPSLQTVKSARSLSETYEQIFLDHSQAFDQNCDYRVLKLSTTSFRASSNPSEEIRTALQGSASDAALGCIQKAGVISSFSTLRNQGLSRVSHPRCVFRGDPECVYEVEFPEITVPKARSAPPYLSVVGV